MWMGYSAGKWENDTLVVDSFGFNDRTWLDAFGHPHSESMRVTERFRRVDLAKHFQRPQCLQPVGRRNALQALLQQSLDRVFIISYLSLFLYFAVINFRFAFRGWKIAIGVLAAVIVSVCACGGAWYDWVEDDRIVGSSPPGRATVWLFQMNASERTELRTELRLLGYWPPASSH